MRRLCLKELRLFAKINDESLLFDLIHELGASFYKQLGDGTTEVLYFSGSKIVHFKGKITPQNLEKLKTLAWQVQDMEIDETSGFVKIKQLKQEGNAK